MMPADVTPLCADDLALVDAAFERSKAGNAAARELAKLCRRCSLAESCLREITDHPEAGVWGGVKRMTDPSAAAGLPSGRLKVVA